MKQSKKVLAGLLSAAALITGFYAATVTAAPPKMIETIYYNDANHTTEVGYRVRLCSGRTVTSGTVTPYTEVSSEPCM